MRCAASPGDGHRRAASAVTLLGHSARVSREDATTSGEWEREGEGGEGKEGAEAASACATALACRVRGRVRERGERRSGTWK
jgi:hypothetical protein